MLISSAAVSMAQDSWTVAGEPEDVFGSYWNEMDENNDMTTEDGTVYTLSKKASYLEAGTIYQYKVVKNHSWSESYGLDNGANKTFDVYESGYYDITFTFNAETKNASEILIPSTKDSFTVTFVNVLHWEKVCIYLWNTDGTTATALLGYWPGLEIPKTGTTTLFGEEFDTYSYTYEGYKAPDWVIFNNSLSGDGNQTSDFVFEPGKVYDRINPPIKVKVGETGFALLAEPKFILDFRGENEYFTAYRASWVSDGTVNFVRVTNKTRAGYALLIKAEPNTTVEIPTSYSATEYGNNLLMGTNSNTHLTADETGEAYYYVLKGDGQGDVGFYAVESDGATVPAGQAYLKSTTPLTLNYKGRGNWLFENSGFQIVDDNDDNLAMLGTLFISPYGTTIVRGIKIDTPRTYKYLLKPAFGSWGYGFPFANSYSWTPEEAGVYDLSFALDVNQQTFSLHAVRTVAKGDVNGDYIIDVADIASIISVMADAETTPETERAADVNGDGKVDVADIATIISIMVGYSPGDDTDNAPVGAVAVDLGLPSGTKWANMNVGAETPEDYGLYFAWGETVGYTSDTSDGRSFDWSSYKWCSGSYYTMSKYCTDSSYGIVDNKTVLDLEDDAARANWGGQWVMPTLEEIAELFNNTTNEWTTVNGVNGRKFTSKANDNYIFLPAAGHRDGSSLLYQTQSGYYWSSTVYPSNSDCARGLYFGSWNVDTDINIYRSIGQSVRPILRN